MGGWGHWAYFAGSVPPRSSRLLHQWLQYFKIVTSLNCKAADSALSSIYMSHCYIHLEKIKDISINLLCNPCSHSWALRLTPTKGLFLSIVFPPLSVFVITSPFPKEFIQLMSRFCLDSIIYLHRCPQLKKKNSGPIFQPPRTAKICLFQIPVFFTPPNSSINW